MSSAEYFGLHPDECEIPANDEFGALSNRIHQLVDCAANYSEITLDGNFASMRMFLNQQDGFNLTPSTYMYHEVFLQVMFVAQEDQTLCLPHTVTTGRVFETEKGQRHITERYKMQCDHQSSKIIGIEKQTVFGKPSPSHTIDHQIFRLRKKGNMFEEVCDKYEVQRLTYILEASYIPISD